jgi:hypothetical protein
MSYQDKYIKYKLKYLNLLKYKNSLQTGGSNSLFNISELTDTPVNNLTELNNLTMTPYTEQQIQTESKSSQKGGNAEESLFTTLQKLELTENSSSGLTELNTLTATPNNNNQQGGNIGLSELESLSSTPTTITNNKQNELYNKLTSEQNIVDYDSDISSSEANLSSEQ